MKFLILIFFINTGWSKVVDHSVTMKKMEFFTMKEACEELGHTDLLLVDKKDRSHLDCMGTYETVTSFCEKKYAKSNTLTRGYIDDTSNQVICEFGSNVILKVACDKRDVRYCKKPKEGCGKLKKIFAVHHVLFRSTIVNYLTGKALNCLFAVKVDALKNNQLLKSKLKK